MEIKSRYEVISEIENKKRELIKERDGFNDVLVQMEKEIKLVERNKSDHILQYDRKIDDLREGIENFKKNIDEKKSTIIQLIESANDSLKRFGEMSKQK